MIFPQTNSAPDVNVAMIRIAQMNNKDIDAMTYEIGRIDNQQNELQARHDSQVKRWRNYRSSFESIQIQFQALFGNVSESEVATTLPGYDGVF